jgi:hypothetical protein
MVKKLSLEEYKELGIEMKFLGDRLVTLSVRIANDIGVSKKESKQIQEIERAFSKCKSNMEDLMFSQYSTEEGGTPKVFYGERILPPDLCYKKEQAESQYN